MKNKLDWIKTLKVGDVVCDCRFKHLKIKSIDNEFIVKKTWIWYSVFTMAEYFPENIQYSITDVFDNLYYKICRKFGWLELVDRQIELEDGANCSAIHCCEPVDHKWKHD